MVLIDELKELLALLWADKKNVVPRKFIFALKNIMSGKLEVHEQNDLQEFVSILLDCLNKNIGQALPHDHKLAPEVPSIKYRPYARFFAKLDAKWTEAHKGEYSPLIDMFFGQQINQIKCDICNHISHMYETFSSIALGFPDNKSMAEGGSNTPYVSMRDLVEHYMVHERVADRECDGCKARAPGVKSHKLWRMPRILIVFLKRFRGHLHKLNYKVHVDEVLQLQKYVIDGRDTQYQLRSIGCHVGGLQYGHYFAVCQHPDGQWYLYDDATVQGLERGLSQINSACYYMMVYERITT